MPEKTTTAQLLAKPIQYGVETTEGTQFAGTATVMGAVESLKIKKDNNYIEVGQLGPEDLIKLVKGLKKYETQISLKPTDITFISRAIKSANYATPTGTISESISIFIVIYLNGALTYINLLGSREKDISYTREIGKDDLVTLNFTHTSITLPSASAPAGVTLSSTFASGTVYHHLTGGSNPLSIGGGAVNATKFSITVNRNTTEDHTLGNADPYGTQPHGRRIGGDFTLLWTNDDMETAESAGTEQTIALVLNSTGPVTLTISNAVVTVYDRSLDVSDDKSVVEVCGWKAPTVTVA